MKLIIKIVIAIILAFTLMWVIGFTVSIGILSILFNSLTKNPTYENIKNSNNKLREIDKYQINRPNYSKNAPFFIQPPMNTAENIIYDMGDKFQENIRRQKYLNENPDIMDMPPWEHENKWHKIFNNKQTCWYHKKSMKKVCEPS